MLCERWICCVLGSELCVVKGTYDSCVVRVDSDINIFVSYMNQPQSGELQGNRFSPANVMACSLPATLQFPCGPLVCDKNPNPAACGGIHEDLGVELRAR